MFHSFRTHADDTVTDVRSLRKFIFYCGLLIGLLSANSIVYSQIPPGGTAIATDTKSGFLKSNQSKVFYHDGKWWAIAFNNPDSRWYIWKYNSGVWTKDYQLNKTSTLRYDAVLDAVNGKLYVLGSHTSNSEFWRFTYSSGTATWLKDSGFKVTPGMNNSDGANPMSLVQAKNGELWIFRVESNKLQAKRSADGGLTWSAVFDIKTGLTTSSGLTDAVVFTSGGNNYIGVAYGEADAAGSKYGFLIHRDGDPETTWTDESASLTFFGSERANNKIAATTDKNNNVYLFGQNANVSGGDPHNTLYKRSSGGAWTKFVVNDNASGLSWKAPVVIADTSNNGLYVMGVNNTTLSAEYKACVIGSEANLSSTTPTVVLSSASASFDDLSLPAASVSASSNLMVCGDNLTASDIWFNLITLGPISGGQPPVTVNSVVATSNEANANASYTISLTLGDEGALNAGSGTITILFPNNTFVPGGIAASQITVNGTAAAVAASNSSTREVIITTPVSLANNANVTLAFDTGANLLNPSTVGNYTLQASTSVQTTPASSPSYAISAATTSVSTATVTPNPTATSAAAAYTINFNLGARGRLLAGSSTISLAFDAATGVTNGSLSGAQVNGVSATASGNSVNKTVTVTVPASINLDNSAAVTISLPASAITNPASAGNYTLLVFTSVENTAVVSNPYNIVFVGPVTVGAISLSNNEVNTNSSYTVPITLGSTGALTAGSGTITLQFPANTSVPSSITASQITVNGTAASAVTSNSSTRQVTITTPVTLANSASITIVLNLGANLINPSIFGSYNLQAWTSAQPASATSPSYTIAAATTTVSAASVTPNPVTPSSAAAYTIAFNLGARGALVAGSSTMTITFNSSTSVSNGSLSGVQVNGTSATATGNSGNKTVVITAPASLSLGNNAAITVSLPSSAITNPSSDGSYTLTVATSVETSPTTSNSYSISSPPPPPATGEDNPISGTTGGYNKPHQNRPFYHAGVWWTAARKSSDGKWYLWKLSGSSWSAEVEIDSRASMRPDCYVDSPSNKLYILLASTSSTGTKILRLSYSGSSWSIDSGFPVVLSSFTFSGESGNNFVKAKNGELWAFRYSSGKVDGKRSSDDGASWSSTFTVKGSINSSGLQDAVAFTYNGQNYIGAGYGENTGGSNFGFLRHQDGDPEGSWTDETSSIPQLTNADPDDHMSLAVSQNNEIFFICKTHPNSGSAAGIGLFKRSANGSWQNFTIQQGGGWTRPAVVVDETNNELYVMGTQEGSPGHGQYRKCTIGDESSLLNAAIIDFFDSDDFNNISVPQHRVTGATDLLVCVEKSNGSEVWYNLLPISGSGGGSPTPLTVSAVTVNPNTSGQTASYTIPITLGSNGELNGGSDTITVTWPSGTTVPASIANTSVTINGSNSNSVTTTPASRQAVVTVPSDLNNSASVALVFTSSAGIINPSTAGSYTLAVKTSVEMSEVNSPSYSISAPAITPVTVGNITVNQDTVNRVASYTIPITLGSSGALTGGSGTIAVTWPNNTTIPATITNAAVTVNGSNANSITTTPASRQAVVTVPNTLANNASVTLIFTSAAGIVNPSTAGNYTLQAQTSAQAIDANSPSYVINNILPPPGIAGVLAEANTNAILSKSNQSKLFYYQSTWWMAAYDVPAGDWFLWKLQSGVWVKDLMIDSRTSVRIDVVLDSVNNRLYFVCSHSSTTKFGRWLYSNGAWTKEMSLVSLSNFGDGGGANPISLARAQNGELWLFRITGGVLDAKLSTDLGATWSSNIVVKSGLIGSNGATDGVAFPDNGVQYAGVFYGMSAASGGNSYGFLRHQDGAASTVWTDESSQFTFFGAELADEAISVAKADNGKLFALTRNSNAAAAGDAKNTLYKRNFGGAWVKFKVNTGVAWSSPVVGLDDTNDRLYVMGVRTDSPSYAEYKSCDFSSETILETQSHSLLLKNNGDNFGEITGVGKSVYSASGLLVCGGNLTTDDVWYNIINFSTPKAAAPPAAQTQTEFSRVAAYPNPFNPATTIRFTLNEAAAVNLQIFNIRGELVKTVVERDLAAGVHEQRWNGRDQLGRRVASGIYFYRLRMGGEILLGRLEMIK